MASFPENMRREFGYRLGLLVTTTWPYRPGAVAGIGAPFAVISGTICSTAAPPPGPNWTSTMGMAMGVSAVPYGW
jgi:hypothetical protein